MAFSATGYSSALQAAVDYAWSQGVVLVAAAGNDGSSTPAFPAGDRGVIGVSNTDSSDALAGSSNYGASSFLGAPGVGILTTDERRRYSTISGTSASAAARRGRGGAAGRGRSVCLERRRSSAAWPATPTRPGPPRRPATAG